MKLIPYFLVVSAVAATLTACAPTPEQGQTAAPAARGPLEGVWKVAEVTITGGPNEGTNPSPQPSLYIFAKQHYSIIRVGGREPRPLWKEGATRESLTEAEFRAAFTPMTANSGTYELNGSSVTTRPMVALDPNFMSGGSATFEYQVEGDSLLLIDRPTEGPATEVRRKFVRLE